MNDLTIILGGLTLPNQAQLVETTTPNEADVTTLDGSLYTDFINIRRSWSVVFPPICSADYKAIYALYFSQYTNETYLRLECDALSILTTVKANISDKNFQWNGDQLTNFSLTLQEAYAIS